MWRNVGWPSVYIEEGIFLLKTVEGFSAEAKPYARGRGEVCYRRFIRGHINIIIFLIGHSSRLNTEDAYGESLFRAF